MRRRPRTPSLQRGERLLAWAETADGTLVGGSRDAFHLPGRDPSRLPWQEIAKADWDIDERELHVVEVGTFGEAQVEHRLVLTDPDRLLSLVRERVTASIVVQRHVTVRDRLGARVLGRRAPAGAGPIAWFVDYDAGLDPADPMVVEVVDAALAAARADVGE
ncbi:hypothetical protein F0U44_16045 [Nocardioides humilatus]|uniref:Uncharacterized protein n=1 Tax=Nocardioides humilatus TaxID=2607660 RepID=A0A5B1LDW2_9ACTN|nr:hypothetical protein [Nocardioides humilatus]KAA1417797.1 hypothetical protein F0U44_16045 [Nocardioides humilatus]